MPWESIGSVDTGDMPHERAWILLCLRMAKNYIEFVCGEAPDDNKLDIMWNEHEFGEYPSLGVWYDFEEPSEYVSACEEALESFNENVSWFELKQHWKNKISEEEDDEDDEDEEEIEEEDGEEGEDEEEIREC